MLSKRMKDAVCVTLTDTVKQRRRWREVAESGGWQNPGKWGDSNCKGVERRWLLGEGDCKLIRLVGMNWKEAAAGLGPWDWSGMREMKEKQISGLVRWGMEVEWRAGTWLSSHFMAKEEPPTNALLQRFFVMADTGGEHKKENATQLYFTPLWSLLADRCGMERKQVTAPCMQCLV